MYRRYRGRKKKSLLKIAIIILLIALSILITDKLISSSFNNDKEISKNNIQNPSPEDNDISVEETTNTTTTSILQIEPAVPTEYKKGTSHNHEATAWAYSTKDVNTWINKPSSYTEDDKIVFLTFDDGPSDTYTDTVLDILKNYGVHATFFIVGKEADKPHAPAILQRQITEGHAIAYHSYSHSYDTLYPNKIADKSNIMDEIEQNKKAISNALGYEFSSTVLRYPGGHMSWQNLEEVDEELAKQGIYNVDWNLLTGDAESTNSPRYTLSALDNIKADYYNYNDLKIAVVLMHDLKAKSVEELPKIIEFFAAEGYKFGILE